MNAVFDARLVCSVEELRYFFKTRTGNVFFPPANCCDMTGCIRLFKAIDPNVQLIRTYSGGKADTTYQKRREGWVAIDSDGSECRPQPDELFC